jgi:hypothetical protein
VHQHLLNNYHGSIPQLQQALLKQKAVLMYFEDVQVTHPHFEALQFLALRGIVTDWKARLDEPISQQEISQWKQKIKISLPAMTSLTRGQYLQQVYEKIKHLSDQRLKEVFSIS